MKYKEVKLNFYQKIKVVFELLAKELPWRFIVPFLIIMNVTIFVKAIHGNGVHSGIFARTILGVLLGAMGTFIGHAICYAVPTTYKDISVWFKNRYDKHADEAKKKALGQVDDQLLR